MPKAVSHVDSLPDGWQMIALKRLATVRSGVTKGRALGDRRTVELPYLRVANVQDGWIDLSDVAMIAVGTDEVERYCLKSGDVLMNEGGDNDKLGRGAVWDASIDPCLHQNHVFAVRPHGSVISEWIARVTESTWGKAYFEQHAKQSTNLASISSTSVSRLPVPVPPLETQRRIAAFLDRKTAAIDALIAKKQRLITLLQEKRQALITHAVTKGLNPKAPMKDSGIPWIGEIPAHWTLQPIKRFVRFHNNRRIPLSGEERADLEKVYDYYGASGVIDKVDRYLFDHDHILIGEDGANLLSRSSPLAFVAKGKYWVNNHAHILEPIGGQLSFWAERLECFSYAPFVTGAAQPKLTIEALGGIPISAPDISEQAEIGFYTESVNAIFGPKAETIALSITKLTEYRQSLISAAVTGQLPLPEETA